LIAEHVNWLGDSRLAMGAVITAYVWRTTPFNILLYHAGLQGIPRDYYEAAEVDGASRWSRFWRITLPLLRPVIAVSLILRTAFAFMVFDEIFAITQGGPGNATWVAAWYTYRAAFQPPFNVGLGSASAWVMALILAVAGLAYARLVGRRLEPRAVAWRLSWRRRALLWLANLAAIAFLLAPLAPVVLASLQSEKVIQRDVRALLPREITPA